MSHADDPYNDFKTIHLAGLMNNKGGVSPKCAEIPKALNLRKATWTLNERCVDCPKCLAAMGIENPKAVAKKRREDRIARTI